MEIRKDTLFLALTRPAMKLGVPALGFGMNFVLSFFVGLWGNNPFYWLICIAIHFAMRIIASSDPNFFRIWYLWLITKGSAVGSDAWGGAMLSPIPDFIDRKKAAERSSCV